MFVVVLVVGDVFVVVVVLFVAIELVVLELDVEIVAAGSKQETFCVP